MKKTIIASIAAFAIVSTSSANLGDVLIDSAIGGGIGAVIGNNTGDGDSETGAIIGAVSGGVAGWRNRSGGYNNHYPQTMPHGRSYPTPSRVYNTHRCPPPVVTYDSTWVKPVYNYDAYGTPFIVRHGYWSTDRRIVPAFCTYCP